MSLGVDIPDRRKRSHTRVKYIHTPRNPNSPVLYYTPTGIAEITVGDSSSTPQLTFDQPQYVKEIHENAAVDTTVTTVQVSPYSGSGAVTYSFANGNDHNTFKINSRTGR